MMIEREHIMNPDDETREDRQFAELFGSLERNAAPVDPQLREKLRKRSAEAFADASAEEDQNKEGGTRPRPIAGGTRPRTITEKQSGRGPVPPAIRRKRMFAIAARGLAATAAAIVVAAALWTVFSPGDGSLTFGSVLENTANAETLHLEIDCGGQSTELWAKGPKLRWNAPDGTYKIASGETMWEIDEKANRATSQKSPFFDAQQPGLNVLPLLDLPGDADADNLLGAEPAERVERDGRQCDLYRVELAAAEGPIRVEALVDAGSGLLRSLEAKANRTGRWQPLTRITVLAAGEPVDEEKFVVGDTLTEDGRIGKVTDAQGIVIVRPVMHKRFSPLRPGMLIKPGDWVRTDIRGANAVKIRLVKQTDVTLGPGTLVELSSPKQIKLISGELKIVADKKAPVKLLGSTGQKIVVKGKQFFRLGDDEKLVAVKKDPLWLRGFEGATANESIGSLVAKVDGRDVPLTVGYHKVTVDIRDQIARTVIEESFVNHTKTQLEGVFFFPLPQDASISGFGMWIGDELVEADVVEKQRAREIYETILREKRDPGLLEWSGGNLFKARVYPIFPHSEKRIKITYTQVLPMRGNRYRYSYALQSEMLKKNPLRELGIDVKIHSAVPLANVTSPTHPARIEKTDHSGHVEFAAQEYTPSRDFEVVVEVGPKVAGTLRVPSAAEASAVPDVVVIPHRRGDDGYFMLQLMPPDGEGQWQRDVLPDGKPLELLILADTSASLDRSQRNRQTEFIASLLGSLTPDDRFNLAGCDVGCDWVFKKPQPATDKNIKDARRFLDGRISLGWTDLDNAFASAMKQCGRNTQVIYVGDGIVTAGDGDPVEASNRLRRLCDGKAGGFHAVAPGSLFEPVVLKTIAALGGGSVRQITGEKTPQMVAGELLGEIARPSIRDLKLEFRGLQTARVYPEQLPNLPAGTQQIILGRYLPEGEDQTGEVVVTGTLDGKPVRFKSRITLKDAEHGNSFIPRLWARMHLDTLLQQGTTSVIKDEIIGLSEEYHIMTPYTSLLVLENDADRERFKVKRRFQMRDGQKFFAEGRDTADYELIQKQMRLAGNWRLGLRRNVLRQLSGLGRNPQIFQPSRNHLLRDNNMSIPDRGTVFLGGIAGVTRAPRVTLWNGQSMPEAGIDTTSLGLLPFLGAGQTYRGGRYKAAVNRGLSFLNGRMASPVDMSISGRSDSIVVGDDMDGGWRYEPREEDETSVVGWQTMAMKSGHLSFLRIEERYKNENAELGAELGDINGRFGFDFDGDEWWAKERLGGRLSLGEPRATATGMSLHRQHGLVATMPLHGGELLRFDDTGRWVPIRAPGFSGGFGSLGGLGRFGGGMGGGGGAGYGWYEPRYEYSQWLDTLFPELPPEPPAPVKLKRRWPADARKLAESLLRTKQIAGLEGLRIECRTDQFDPRFGEPTSRYETLSLISPKAWLIGSVGTGWQTTTVEWCDAKRRGIFSGAFLLGRERESTPSDLAQPPLDLSVHLTTSLERSYHYRDCQIELQPQGGDRTMLVLRNSTRNHETRMLIDTDRHVVLSIEYRNHGELTSTTEFGDFVRVAGAWWATRIENFDHEHRRTSLVTVQLTPLSAGAFAREMKQKLAALDRVQLIREPLPGVVEAKKAVARGKADFDDQLVLTIHFSCTQQWDRVMEHLDAAEKSSDGKPGVRWIRDAVLKDARRNEELKKRIMAEAKSIAKPQAADDLFLAGYLLSEASRIFGPNEMLALLDVLKPVYRRQPKRRSAMNRWTLERITYLRSASRAEEAFALRKKLAVDYPRDCGLQTQYANALAGRGEYGAAYAWLDRALADRDARWRPNEEESLRDTYAQLLERQGRYEELVDWLAAWVAKNPERHMFVYYRLLPYQRYLSALIRTDRTDKADELIARWLKEGQVPGRLPHDVQRRLEAAVNQALGQGYNMYANRIDERWLGPLAEAVMFFARHETQQGTADQIMGTSNFTRSDECREVRRKIARILAAEIDTLEPDRIGRFVDWIWPNDPAIEKRQWKRIADALERRWAEESKPELKEQLAGPLVRILEGRIGVEEYLAFLRRQMAEGPKKYRTGHARQLFNTLLDQPWTIEYEDEAFGLIEKLSDAKEPAERLLAEVQALYRMTDRMVPARFAALMKKVEHPEKLTRIELREKQAANMKAARRGFAGRIAKLQAAEELAKWMLVERLYLDILTEHQLDKVTEECWEIVGPFVGRPSKAVHERGEGSVDGLGRPSYNLELFEEIRRGRCLMMLANLAARRNAKPQLAERLLAYIDQGIQSAPKAPGWKLLKYRMLIALDRPKDLEKNLRAWIRTDDPANQWRVSLAYLLAEQGKIAEAIKLLEAVKADDELGPAEYRTLADWYMVVDRREDHEQALIEVYMMMEEWRMRNWLQERLHPWQHNDGHLPSELDKNVLRMFAALFRKSGHPQNYLWRLRQFYGASRDFRLLACLADGVVGHTAGKVYPFLQNMDSVLNEVRDEATADSLVEEIEKVRGRAKTDVDRRALDLLEALVERRSSEVLNQPGPHVDRALTAMQRAFKRKWSGGEPRLMADLLAGLGHVSQKKLADEQVRELEVLHHEARKGTIDRLHIAHSLARTYWTYSRQDKAIDLLQSALDEYQAANRGVLPADANGPLDTFISHLEQQGHHARGEKVLFAQLRHPVNNQQKHWLKLRLYQLYDYALRRHSDVSLGKDEVLFKAADREMRDELGTNDHNYRRQVIERLCTFYRTAKDVKIPVAADRLKDFAFKQVPEVLKRQTNNYQWIVSNVAQTLHDVAGPRAGLEFLIERIENEPGWFRLNNQDGWSRFGYQLARWRSEAKDVGDLEKRLLAIVTAELRRDLESRQGRNRDIYYMHSAYSWKEKAKAFARVAEKVYAERKDSGESVRYIAEYLYHGLDRHDRAIEMLFVALGDKILDESGQSQLVQYLHEQKRYGESIAVLGPLVEQRPGNMQYCTWLMHAYFRTNRKAELLALLKQTDEYFHKENRWNESAMAALAYSCLENELFEQSVAYYEELIPLHQRTQPRRGIGNGTLSEYYANMARAYAGRKNTAKAVDAACGAIVSWGPRLDNRRNAVESLKQVLREAPDLDAYVAGLDKETEKSGLGNPIVRKALGMVYAEKKQWAKAIPQLRLACELQPNDAETHKTLIACYDHLKDKQGAIDQLLESVELSRREIKLYEDLGRRLGELEQPGQMERAYTSIVEALPAESESHALLAQIRQKQDRWDEAIVQWRQVARIRELEPTGLLGLAAAQIHQRQWDAAAETLQKLDKGWPPRFSNVEDEIRKLREQIEKGRKR